MPVALPILPRLCLAAGRARRGCRPEIAGIAWQPGQFCLTAGCVPAMVLQTLTG